MDRQIPYRPAALFVRAVEALLGYSPWKAGELERVVVLQGGVGRDFFEDLVGRVRCASSKGVLADEKAFRVICGSPEDFEARLEIPSMTLSLSSRRKQLLELWIFGNAPGEDKESIVLYACTESINPKLDNVKVLAPLSALADESLRTEWERRMTMPYILLPVPRLSVEQRAERLRDVGKQLAQVVDIDERRYYSAFLAAVASWWPELRLVFESFLANWVS